MSIGKHDNRNETSKSNAVFDSNDNAFNKNEYSDTNEYSNIMPASKYDCGNEDYRDMFTCFRIIICFISYCFCLLSRSLIIILYVPFYISVLYFIRENISNLSSR